MHPHLARCGDLLAGAIDGPGTETTTPRIDGRWTIAEIVEHLQRAYTGTAKGLDRCLQEGRPVATPRRLRHLPGLWLVVRAGYLPSGRQAPRQVTPTGTLTLAEAHTQAQAGLVWLDRSASLGRERFGGVPVLDHPILGPFSVDDWLKFHLVHTRHHGRQIRARRSG